MMSQPPRTFTAGALAIALIGTVAPAQTPNADIVHCSQSEGPEARIRCLEAAIRRLSEDTADTVQHVPTTTITTDAVDGEPQQAIPFSVPAATVVQSESAADPRESAPQPESFGEEQIARAGARENHASERIHARVVEFEFVGRNKLQVRLENGQIWRQSNADRADLYRPLRNEDSFDVELWKTRRSGYRMYVPKARRTLLVSRIR